MIKKIAFLFLFTLTFFRSEASHLMGGEITWECLSSGQFLFHMKVYKDCWQSGTNNFPVMCSGCTFIIDVTNHPSVLQIPMTLVDSVDISPNCNPQGPVYNCNAGSVGNGAIMEFNFKSNPITLNGVPPPAGWIFSWGNNCCRNACINNIIGPSGMGITLKAKMFAYQGRNEYPCFDNSPEFAQRPAIVICSGYPFTYNHNAFDKELDDLRYSWDAPLRQYPQGNFAAVTPCPINTAQGFSVSSPFPGTSWNPANVPAVLDTITGAVSFTSYTLGCFVTVVKVSAYKCGALVAEISRDIQVQILSCGGNVPPLVIPPFAGGTSFDTTVYGGALVTFKMLAIDSGWDPSGAFHQLISFQASGAQFDTDFVNVGSGCLNPPCATLLPAPFPVSQLQDSVFFSWQTDCHHVNYTNHCNNPILSNTYTFVITAMDDYCPAPGPTIATISITVLQRPLSGIPEIRCASILPNGDVSLSWVPPPDPGGTFSDYYIYSATSAGGPYVPIDSSINTLATNSFVHVGANAQVTPRFYYLKSRSGCNGLVHSGASDTLQAILLNVSNPGTGFASLAWPPLHSPVLPSSDGLYKIFRKIGAAGAWTLIDSTLNTFYSDPIFKCNDTVAYRVELADSLPCNNVSSVDQDVFFDNTPPATPFTDSVSIDPLTGLIYIGWEADTSIDTRGYIIYHVLNGANVYLDTVFGINNLAYTTSFTTSCVDSFRILAYDSCRNISAFNRFQRTMCLTATLNSCLQGADLNWSTYLNWPGGVGSYNVFRSENGGPFLNIGTATDTTYFDAPININSVYNYYVQALSDTGGESSSSNMETLVAYVIKLPQYLYIRTATVSDEPYVRIDCHVDITADVKKYKILRSTDQYGVYDTIAKITATTDPLVSFVDSFADPAKRSYYYKAVAVDICNAEHPSDNYGKTIFLQAHTNDDLTNTIYWSDYESWSGGVTKYQIFRQVSGNWDPNPAGDVDFGTTTYRDDISPFIDSDGNFCYYVKALEGAGNIYGFSDTSLSNIACVIQGPRLNTPNAFSPDGKNPVFYPVNAFIDVTDFQFVIYDRWGTLIYQTTNHKEGWDGRIKGQEAASGVYIYLLKMTGTNGKVLERKGTISLIR